MAGVASEDLLKKLLAINPYQAIKDVIARCRSEESATNTEADLTSKPVVNAARRADPPCKTSSGVRSAPRKTQPSSTKTICRFCGGRPHRTRSDCPAYGTTCTAYNRLHHFAEVCESRNNSLLSQSPVNPTQRTASLAAQAHVASRTRTAPKVTLSLHTADFDARHLGLHDATPNTRAEATVIGRRDWEALGLCVGDLEALFMRKLLPPTARHCHVLALIHSPSAWVDAAPLTGLPFSSQ